MRGIKNAENKRYLTFKDIFATLEKKYQKNDQNWLNKAIYGKNRKLTDFFHDGRWVSRNADSKYHVKTKIGQKKHVHCTDSNDI